VASEAAGTSGLGVGDRGVHALLCARAALLLRFRRPRAARTRRSWRLPIAVRATAARSSSGVLRSQYRVSLTSSSPLSAARECRPGSGSPCAARAAPSRGARCTPSPARGGDSHRRARGSCARAYGTHRSLSEHPLDAILGDVGYGGGARGGEQRSATEPQRPAVAESPPAQTGDGLGIPGPEPRVYPRPRAHDGHSRQRARTGGTNPPRLSSFAMRCTG